MVGIMEGGTAVQCASCFEQIPTDADFCGHCGSPVTAPQPPPAAAVAPPAMGASMAAPQPPSVAPPTSDPAASPVEVSSDLTTFEPAAPAVDVQPPVTVSANPLRAGGLEAGAFLIGMSAVIPWLVGANIPWEPIRIFLRHLFLVPDWIKTFPIGAVFIAIAAIALFGRRRRLLVRGLGALTVVLAVALVALVIDANDLPIIDALTKRTQAGPFAAVVGGVLLLVVRSD